jgi:hypothetical protein
MITMQKRFAAAWLTLAALTAAGTLLTACQPPQHPGTGASPVAGSTTGSAPNSAAQLPSGAAASIASGLASLLPSGTETPAPAATPPTSPEGGPMTSFGDGTWHVGTDIAAGTYTSAGPADTWPECYWARAKDATGDLDSILANDNVTGRAEVTVRAGEYFTSQGCQTWTLTSGTGAGG